jgi:xanthosine utilization system XapX-like protein
MYLILLSATILIGIVAVFHRRWEQLPAIVICILIFIIGLSFNGQVCPFIMCLGATPGQGN